MTGGAVYNCIVIIIVLVVLLAVFHSLKGNDE